MVEIWIKLIVNERRWHIVNDISKIENDQQLSGDVAYYEVDKKRKHYFYFVHLGIHYVLSGYIQRTRLLPSFTLQRVTRDGFKPADVVNVCRMRNNVQSLPCTSEDAHVRCERDANGLGIACELFFYAERPANAEEEHDAIHITIDDSE